MIFRHENLKVKPRNVFLVTWKHIDCYRGKVTDMVRLPGYTLYLGYYLDELTLILLLLLLLYGAFSKTGIFFCNWSLETLDISILRSKRQINIPVVVNLKFRWNKLLLLQYVNWVLCLHSAYVLIHCIESLSSAIVRYLFIYWFIHIVVDLFTSFLNTILIRCLTDGRADKLIERLRDWLTNLRANWYTDEITYWLTDWPHKWLTYWPNDLVTDWIIEWLTNWPTDQLSVKW